CVLFFSSRRRHTRCYRDWSSDVCSSDLALLVAKMYDEAADELRYAQAIWGDLGTVEATFAWTYREQGKSETGSRQFSFYRGSMRSEERRVGKECRGGREPRHV